MATISTTISRSASSSTGSALAKVTLTVTYSTATSNTAVSVSATKLVISDIYATSGGTARTQAISLLLEALSSTTVKLTYGGQTVFSKASPEADKTYTVSGTKSVNRGTSATTATLSLTGTGNNKSISIPALQSWDITFNANSGSGAPTTQKKYYGIALTLSSAKPNKSGYKFNGWATSEANAKNGAVAYNAGGTIPANTNSALSLWAVWELAYEKPTIDNLRIDRCDQNGTLDDDGTYALVTFDWSIYVSANARYYGGSAYPYSSNSPVCSVTVGTETVTPTLTGTSASVVVGNGTFDTDTSYDVTVTLSDTQAIVGSNTTTVSGALYMAMFPIDINADATAIGLLMPAPDGATGVYMPELDVTGDITASGAVTDGKGNSIPTRGYFYANTVTATAISSTSTPTKVPITGIHSGSGFEYDSTNKGIKCTEAGTYMISVQQPFNPATSGDLMGLSIYRNGVQTIGPVYARMGGNYDTVIISPTIIELAEGDYLTLYAQNNSASRGQTQASTRFSAWKVD